jgi:hypothetical protein
VNTIDPDSRGRGSLNSAAKGVRGCGRAPLAYSCNAGASAAPAGNHYRQFSSLSFQYFVPATAIPAWSPFFVSE